MEQLKNIIEQAWLDRSLIEKPETKEAINEVVRLLDLGEIRVAWGCPS